MSVLGAKHQNVIIELQQLGEQEWAQDLFCLLFCLFAFIQVFLSIRCDVCEIYPIRPILVTFAQRWRQVPYFSFWLENRAHPPSTYAISYVSTAILLFLWFPFILVNADPLPTFAFHFRFSFVCKLRSFQSCVSVDLPNQFVIIDQKVSFVKQVVCCYSRLEIGTLHRFSLKLGVSFLFAIGSICRTVLDYCKNQQVSSNLASFLH